MALPRFVVETLKRMWAERQLGPRTSCSPRLPGRCAAPTTSAAKGVTRGKAQATNGSLRTFSARPWPPSSTGNTVPRTPHVKWATPAAPSRRSTTSKKAAMAPDLTKALEKLPLFVHPRCPSASQHRHPFLGSGSKDGARKGSPPRNLHDYLCRDLGQGANCAASCCARIVFGASNATIP